MLVSGNGIHENHTKWPRMGWKGKEVNASMFFPRGPFTPNQSVNPLSYFPCSLTKKCRKERQWRMEPKMVKQRGIDAKNGWFIGRKYVQMTRSIFTPKFGGIWPLAQLAYLTISEFLTQIRPFTFQLKAVNFLYAKYCGMWGHRLRKRKLAKFVFFSLAISSLPTFRMHFVAAVTLYYGNIVLKMEKANLSCW